MTRVTPKQFLNYFAQNIRPTVTCKTYAKIGRCSNSLNLEKNLQKRKVLCRVPTNGPETHNYMAIVHQKSKVTAMASQAGYVRRYRDAMSMTLLFSTVLNLIYWLYDPLDKLNFIWSSNCIYPFVDW